MSDLKLEPLHVKGLESQCVDKTENTSCINNRQFSFRFVGF